MDPLSSLLTLLDWDREGEEEQGKTAPKERRFGISWAVQWVLQAGKGFTGVELAWVKYSISVFSMKKLHIFLREIFM